MEGAGIGFGSGELDIELPVGGGLITTLLRSANGSRPGLAKNSRYSSCKWINGQLRQAGRFAISCN